ncbi:transcription initiation protein spt5 protein [Lichtheimia corymbifera JMRC:FSU:9682]|uniref:Transcription initiation protein spt5 protein n=1 Tax=Lichtheimia corymbifera JMRC:FSU:9682 TaxID=1263082 RepID=A0A068RMW4_9FUNG|nr:transcription initiation protein spt5 protein [Lichtheimia corymbifera JMRC:FSU:9682]
MLLVTWIALEIAFWLYLYNTKRRFQQYVKPQTLPTKIERQQLFWNCYHTIKHDLKKWFEGWFYIASSPDRAHPSFKDIHRDNVATWFAWAFWVEQLDHVLSNKEWAQEIEWMINTIEKDFDIEFPKGYNDNIQCIRPSFDPVQSLHRPLALYLANYVMTCVFNRVLLEWFWQFERGGTDLPGVMWGHLLRPFYQPPPMSDTNKFNHLVYWSLVPSSSHHQTSREIPIVFVHGIGAGLTVYAEFIHRLVRLGRPIFCVELPYVSMRMVEHIPTPEETVREIEMMLTAHGYDEAVIVAHSLGTAVASWIANLAPKRVVGLVLVDPICFLLNYHHVAFNMLHRIPKRIIEYLIHYFASRELYINYYISRHFQWYQTIFFAHPTSTTSDPPPSPVPPEQQGPLRNATVFLSENDAIVDSPLITKYLYDAGVQARLMRDIGHAEFLINGQWKDEIVTEVEKAVSCMEDEGLGL